MTRPQDQQDVSASTVQESFDDTILGAKPLNELNKHDPNNDWTRGEDSEEDDQYVSPVVKTKEEVDYSARHKEEEEATKWEPPVAMDITVIQIYTKTSTYRKHLIALFVLKKIHERNNPFLFGRSMNHENSYNE